MGFRYSVKAREIGCASLRAHDDQELLLHEQAVGDDGWALPGPRSLAIDVSRWARSISKSFMAEQGKDVSQPEQVCPCCQFQGRINNSS